MTVKIQRSASLKAVVAYKGLAVVALVATSVISAFSWKYYDALTAIGEDYLATEEYAFAYWLLQKLLHLQPQGLHIIAWISGGYSIILGTATTGLWYGKDWASLMMLIMAGLPLPLEIYEVWHELSWERLLIFALNLAVVGYLVRHRLEAAAARSLERSATQLDSAPSESLQPGRPPLESHQLERVQDRA